MRVAHARCLDCSPCTRAGAGEERARRREKLGWGVGALRARRGRRGGGGGDRARGRRGGGSGGLPLGGEGERSIFLSPCRRRVEQAPLQDTKNLNFHNTSRANVRRALMRMAGDAAAPPQQAAPSSVLNFDGHVSYVEA